MKNKFIRFKVLTLLSLVLSLAAIVVGCAATGGNPTPPSKFEQMLFDTQTNLVPKVVTVTNTVTQTNTVQATNVTGQVITVTNTVTVPQIVTQTNQVEAYTETPKASLVATTNTLGAAASPFTAGIGTIAASGLVALLGLWGHLRSYKLGQTVQTQTATSTALAQEVEAVREFIKTLPSGTQYDTAITTFLQQHQVEAGVASNVLNILANDVSNPEAAAAAKEIATVAGVLTVPATAKA